MKLFTYCNSCNEEVPIKSYASTKPELAMEKGEHFSVNCKFCGISMRKKINEVRAKPNKLILVVGLILSVMVTIALWNVSLVGTISFGIPILIWQQQAKSVHAFNAYKRT